MDNSQTDAELQKFIVVYYIEYYTFKIVLYCIVNFMYVSIQSLKYFNGMMHNTP